MAAYFLKRVFIMAFSYNKDSSGTGRIKKEALDFWCQALYVLQA